MHHLGADNSTGSCANLCTDWRGAIIAAYPALGNGNIRRRIMRGECTGRNRRAIG